MLNGLMGRKIEMTQVFEEDGRCVAVTAIELGPCVVVQRKTRDRDGYEAVQLGFHDELKRRRRTKPAVGHFNKADVSAKRFLREFQASDFTALVPGTVVGLDGVRGAEKAIAAAGGGREGAADPAQALFKPGDKVKVVGISKGKGFQGVIRRFHSHRGPMAHGSRFHRYPGSIGCRTDPGRVNKGHHMPGRMGGERVTVRNLKVVRVDAEANLLLVRGAVPGHRNSLVSVLKDTPLIK